MHTENFSSVLRQLRKENNLTQAELADKAGLNQSTVSQFEVGKKPSKSSVLQIAKALSLDTALSDRLLLAAGYAPESEIDLYSPTLRSIATVLQDPTLREVLRPLCAQILLDFSKSWQSFARGKQAQYGRDWQKSVDLCQQADAELIAPVDILPAYILDTMGTAELHLGNLPKAEQLYNQVAGIVSQSDFSDPYIRALVYTHQGDLHRSQSMWDEALKKYKRAQEQFGGNGNDTDKARVQRKIGLVYLQMGQWYEATSYLEQSLGVFQRLIEGRLTHMLAPYELAKTYIAWGLLYGLRGEWDLALDVRKRALAIAEQFQIPGQNKPDAYLLMQARLYCGYDCITVGKLDPAEEYLSMALDDSKRLQDQKEHGLILLGLAKLYVARADDVKKSDYSKRSDYWKKAQMFFNLARDEHEKRGDKFRYAVTLNHWATLYLRQGDTQTALSLLLDAKQRFRDLSNDYYLGESIVQLCETHYQLRNYCKVTDMAAEEIGKIMEIQKYPFFKHLSLLGALKARAAFIQDRVEEALSDYSKSLIDAVQFNRYLCRRIASELVQDMKTLMVRQDRRAAFEACQRLVQTFQEEVRGMQERGIILDEQQDKLVTNLIEWLKKTVSDAIRQSHEIQPFI